MANYPDTRLKEDLLDPPYGGVGANVWDQSNRTFVDAVARFLGQAFLTYQRQPYTTEVFVTQTAANIGEVAVFQMELTGAAGYHAKSATGITANAATVVLGVFVEPASALAKVRIAVRGIIPASISGLGNQAVTGGGGPVNLTVDYTSGKLKLAAGPDPVVAIGAVDGSALLLPRGRIT